MTLRAVAEPHREPSVPISADPLIRCLFSSCRLASDSRQPTADWNEIAELAVRQGVAPLLFKHIKTSNTKADVPDTAWKRLRMAYFASAEWDRRLYRDLQTVIRCLRTRGIKVIVLKGAFLAEAVYGDAALRPMGDLDLMVRRAELPKAQTALLNAGSVLQEATCKASRRRRSMGLWLSGGVAVDLHWTIVSASGSLSIDPDGLWARARPARIAAVNVLALSPEDLLLHLCVHASFKDRFGNGLRHLCDITETIRCYQPEMDWEQVAERAREWGASRYVGLSLVLALELLGAAVPNGVLEQLVPGGLDPRVLDVAKECVLGQRSYGQPWAATSLVAKAKMFRQRVFLHRDEMAVVYPASRDSRHLLVYYALRVRDVFRAYRMHATMRNPPGSGVAAATRTPRWSGGCRAGSSASTSASSGH